MKKFYNDLPWNKGCDPEVWYRQLGPFVWDSESRTLVLQWKNSAGEYVEKELIRRKLD